MKKRVIKVLIPGLILCICAVEIIAQNPIITHRFTADPTARVFNGRLYIYPSSDTTCTQSEGNNGFCMHNYHVYSTADLTHWTDHGEIINHNTVPWVKPNSYGMWAPDCNYKNGKYYFYFPAMPSDESGFRQIGVAVSDTPTGPFVAEPDYIKGVTGIDPNVFIDDDGTAYLYYGGGETLYGVKLNEDMISIKGKPVPIRELPAKYKEGPFVFKRNDIYYFTFPHAPDGSEEIAYAIGKSPLGPFEYQGKVLERWKDGCWTNHHSFVEYNGQWYLFYHNMDISKDQHLRSVCVDKVYFDENGRIPEIKATKRGVGRVLAEEKIQTDRYSALEHAKVARTRHDYVNWMVKDITGKTVLTYNEVDFGKKEYASVTASVNSPTGSGQMLVYNRKNKLIATFELPKTPRDEWDRISASLVFSPEGSQDLIIKFEGNVEGTRLDWIQFTTK